MGRARLHIPYRNCMMTSVLRDSLGGNCRTIMIANISAASVQMEESISTCRFAERVAMISNTVISQILITPHKIHCAFYCSTKVPCILVFQLEIYKCKDAYLAYAFGKGLYVSNNTAFACR